MGPTGNLRNAGRGGKKLPLQLAKNARSIYSVLMGTGLGKHPLDSLGMKSPALQQQVASVQLAMHVCPVTTPSPHCQRSLRCLGDLGDVLVSHETFPSSWLGLPQPNVISTRSVKLYLPGRMDIQHKLKQSRLNSQLYVGLGPMAFCTALTCYSTSLRSINNSNLIFWTFCQ